MEKGNKERVNPNAQMQVSANDNNTKKFLEKIKKIKNLSGKDLSQNFIADLSFEKNLLKIQESFLSKKNKQISIFF